MGSNVARQGAQKQRAATEQAWPAPTSAPLALAPAAEAAPTPLLGAPLPQAPRLPRVSSLAASLLKLGAAWGVPAQQQQHPGMRRYQHAASTLAVQSPDELEVRRGRAWLPCSAQIPTRSSPSRVFPTPWDPRTLRATRCPALDTSRGSMPAKLAHSGAEPPPGVAHLQDVAASMVLCEAIYRADDFGTEKVSGDGECSCCRTAAGSGSPALPCRPISPCCPPHPHHHPRLTLHQDLLTASTASPILAQSPSGLSTR